MADPIYTADALADVLQPANVQLATMIEHLRTLTDAAQKKNKADGEQEKTAKATQKSILDMAQQVRRGVGAAMATATGAVSQMVGAVTRTLGQFVGAFRPDVITRFDKVVKDLTASIGEVLTPVMEAVIPVFRWLADTVVGVGRAVRDLVGSGLKVAADLFTRLGQLVRDNLSTNLARMLPLFVRLVGVAERLVEPVMAVVGVLSDLGQVILQFQGEIQSVAATVLGVAAGLLAQLAPLVGGLVQAITGPLRVGMGIAGGLVQLLVIPLTTGLKLATAIAEPFAVAWQAVGEAVAEVGGELGALAGDLLGALAQVLGSLARIAVELLKPLAGLVTLLARGLADTLRTVARVIVDMINQLRRVIGLPRIRPTAARDTFRDGSSLGKGATGPNFSSAEEAWKNLVKGTAGLGRADPNIETAKNTGIMATILAGLPDEMAKRIAEQMNKPQPAAAPTTFNDKFYEAFMASVRPQQVRGG